MDTQNQSTHVSKIKASTDAEKIPVIDLEILGNIMDLSRDIAFMNELIHGFLEDTSTLLVNIEHELKMLKHVEVNDLIHAMKGSAKSIGATSLAHCATIIHNNSKSTGELPSLNAVKDLNVDFQKTRDALLGYLQELVDK